MASGCTASSSPSLGGCFNPTTDNCVKYTGPAIPALNICTGDTLTEIEAVILRNIIDFATGTGIMITGIDFGVCSLFTTYVTCCNASGDVPKSLKELLKIIFDTLCALDTRITSLETFVNDLKSGPYSTGCLTGLPASPTFKQIIQSMIIKICDIDSRLTTLAATVAGLSTSLPATIGDFLLAHINSCQGPDVLKKTGTGASANIQLSGATPIGGVIAYFGDLSLFDASGVGRTGTSACGWAFADGRGGRPNWQGVTLVGAAVAGAPSNPAAGGGSYSVGSTGGTPNVTLTAAQIPSVGFSGSTSPATATANFTGANDSRFKFGPDDHAYVYPPQGTPRSTPTTFTFTIPGQSFSGSTSGGGGSHTNMMPYAAATWIIRIS